MPRTNRTAPIAPPSTSSLTFSVCGWWRYMNASASTTPLSRAAALHRVDLGHGEGERLLAQDVLAGPGGPDRPLGVEVVRQRDVDGVDLGVGEECLVGAVRTRSMPHSFA